MSAAAPAPFLTRLTDEPELGGDEGEATDLIVQSVNLGAE